MKGKKKVYKKMSISYLLLRMTVACYVLYSVHQRDVYQEKSRQYRAVQRQREETEIANKKQDQRLKVTFMFLCVMCRFIAFSTAFNFLK